VPTPTPETSVNFVTFVYTLASNAAVHFGDVPEPGATETRQPNLAAAQHVIGLLAMLEEKTRGNLTPEERQFLDQALYELRMRYVAATAPKGRIVEP